jgi:F-type H+-transporting ATPase subunit gamma
MAGTSMKDIKLRIKSVESTMQITKAMELVASSKLRKAKERQERLRPYFEELGKTLSDIETAADGRISPYQDAQPLVKQCLIVIAGDRGLAGGYNANVLKRTLAEMDQPGIETCIIPIGKRALDFALRNSIEVVTDEFAEAATISISDCLTIGQLVSRGYMSGRFQKVTVVYTRFVSLLSQVPETGSLLPLQSLRREREKKNTVEQLMIIEPDPVSVFEAIVPNYLGGMVYGAVCESVASELGARRTAMDAASKNAAEMISDLSLKYNRARQDAITQEITEIVAGAEH